MCYLKAIASISLYSVSNNSICNEFLDIQSNTDGITVPEIKKWTTSGSYGFIFHAWLRFDEIPKDPVNAEADDNKNVRRIILSLLSHQGTGYEIFVDRHGKLVVAVITKKEFLTTTVASPLLLDKRWHLVTVGVIPPKRPFSYTQVTIYIDGNQRLGATLKFGAFTEVTL